jgi:glucosamine-6-phosphate deaminase
MKITVCRSCQDFYDAVAWQIAIEIISKPNAVIGLSTGRTTGGIHKALADIYAAHRFDTSKVTLFGLDEVTNVSRDYYGSCYFMLLHEVIQPLEVPLENFIMPFPAPQDFAKECQWFENTIAARGQVDLQILGIGGNGHIGFNQPGTPFGQTTWVSTMEDWLYERIRNETNSPVGADLGGLTLGIRNVMQSKRIILTANGRHKAEIISKTICGPVDPSVPASVLQLHPNCDVMLDPDAAEKL